MDIVNALLNNQFVQGVLVAGAGWLANKIVGTRTNTTMGRVKSALTTSVAQMLQLALTAPPDMTPERMILQCKGVVAVQFAKVGFAEAQRAKYQPMIDAAIAEAVLHWVKLHPKPKSLKMPSVADHPV